jgi:hypothetical protein
MNPAAHSLACVQNFVTCMECDCNPGLDSDPIEYRRGLVGTLLHDFTSFAECTGTGCK